MNNPQLTKIVHWILFNNTMFSDSQVVHDNYYIWCLNLLLVTSGTVIKPDKSYIIKKKSKL